MMQAMPTTRRIDEQELPTTTSSARGPAARGSATRATLARALELIEDERPREADLLLTGSLLRDAGDSDLWLAAGLARIQRGLPASAAAALRMCHWLSGDPIAEELLEAIG